MTRKRVLYREGQCLTVHDLRDEQEYRIGLMQDHLRLGHGRGVVRGLQLRSSGSSKPAPGSLQVFEQEHNLTLDPGVAVDPGYRVLKVTGPRSIIFNDLIHARGRLLDKFPGVEVLYLCLRRMLVPSGPEGGRSGTGADRVREETILVLTRGLPGTESIPGKAIEPLEQAPPGCVYDEPGLDMVPLCRLENNPKNGWILEELDPLPEVGVIGEQVRSPSGDAVMHIGTDPGDEFSRFSVVLADGKGTLADRRLAVRYSAESSRSRMLMQGPMSVKEDVRLQGVLEFRPVPAVEEDEEPVPRPWQMYRIGKGKDGSPPESLRMELKHPGGDATGSDYRFAIQVNGAADPLFDVRMDGTTRFTAGGKANAAGEPMVVEGVLRESPIHADFSDERFIKKVMELVTSGRLLVEIEILEKVKQNIRYIARVTNVGGVDLTGVEIHQSVTYPRHPQPDHLEQVCCGISLDARASANEGGESVDCKWRFLSKDHDSFVIALLALGVGPAGNIVYAVTSKEVFINE